MTTKDLVIVVKKFGNRGGGANAQGCNFKPLAKKELIFSTQILTSIKSLRTHF